MCCSRLMWHFFHVTSTWKSSLQDSISNLKIIIINDQTAKKTRPRRPAKRKRRIRNGDVAQARPGRARPRPRVTQAAPRLQRDPGWRVTWVALGRSATQAGVRPKVAHPRPTCDPGRARTRSRQVATRPLFLFLGFFFFFSSLMNTYFLLLRSPYFSCKSSLRDSISMQMPREKSATLDVNNP